MPKVNFFNPILQYKAKPGERGSTSSSTTKSSISGVSSYEPSDIQRFENQIGKKGHVIYKNLHLNLSQPGRSEVTTCCPKKSREEGSKGSINTKINNKLHEYNSKELMIDTLLRSVKSKESQPVYKQELKDIQRKKTALQEKKMRLYTQITLLLVQNLNVDVSTINIDLSA